LNTQQAEVSATGGLGYRRYGAQGGGFGAAITTLMALDDPAPRLGIHLPSLDIAPHTGRGRGRCHRPDTPTWRSTSDGGTMTVATAIQPTRPVGYGLNGSPAGLAAWVLEKRRAWADPSGDLGGTFSRAFLLTVVTLYWATQTITSSMRDYLDNRWPAAELGLTDVVTVPTAVAVFAHQFIDDANPPREWAERLYKIRRWTPTPRGGHFPSVEEPGLPGRDIAAFFDELGAASLYPFGH
jgi:hypothetical protein